MEKENYKIPELPLRCDLESKAVLLALNRANRKLAELRGVALTIPNEDILINTLTLQEAKDSSEVENIVTTQDDLYRADVAQDHNSIKASDKEVMNYREALLVGFRDVKATGLLTTRTIRDIQRHLVFNSAGFRTVPGTSLKRNDGEVVYTPPQDKSEIERHMANLEKFINDTTLSGLDPLIKMAIIHHQFESIHPFYDGNGRTGRIIIVLYLVISDLLDLPILYLSRYITHNKVEYYKLLQNIRERQGDEEDWREWVIFILRGIEETATETITLVKSISSLMSEYKSILRPAFGRQYKHELINNLFFHPYTKIEFIERDLMVTRKTAAAYLEKIVDLGLLTKEKTGKTNYYVNKRLVEIFTGQRG